MTCKNLYIQDTRYSVLECPMMTNQNSNQLVVLSSIVYTVLFNDKSVFNAWL